MHPQFLPFLRCPESGEPLELEPRRIRPDGAVEEGHLISPRNRRYEIRAGVPRFAASGGYSESFGFEWDRWSRVQYEAENVGGPMEGHTTAMWERITGSRAREGETVVEFGCGGGRFLDAARRRGARVVGVELSGAADAAARHFRGDPDVLVVQGDVLAPPLTADAFDGGYSIGVLHHTPDPARGAAALAHVVRPGGWVALSVYERGGFYDYPSLRRLRALEKRLRPLSGYRFAIGYAAASAFAFGPALGLLKRMPAFRPAVDAIERQLLPVLHLPDRRWRQLDIFDAITPEIATTHTRDEVLAWLAGAGCTEVEPTPWGTTSAVGTVAG